MQESQLQPVPAAQRSMSGLDLALLWFGAAVVIDELWSGAQLAPAGLAGGVLLIVGGRAAGNLLLAAVAAIGARSGLATMALGRTCFGVRGSFVPAACNVLQLLGWTAYMLVVGVNALAQLLGPAFGAAPRWFWILLLGAITTLWAMGGERYWKPAHRVAVLLLLLLSAVMTWSLLRRVSLAELAAVRPPPGDRSTMQLFDFVLAMAVSWVPLVADYARFCPRPRAAALGTYAGYFAGSCWMYIIGLLGGLAYLAAHPGTPVADLLPDAVVLGALRAFRLVAAGLVLVVLSTVTTTFLDVYSTAVSVLNIRPHWPERQMTLLSGLLGTLLGMTISYQFYFDFLLLIGHVFVPMFAVFLVHHWLVDRLRIDTASIDRRGGPYWFNRGFNPYALGCWTAGFILSLVADRQAWPTGSSLPAFLLTALLYGAMVKLAPAAVPAREAGYP